MEKFQLIVWNPEKAENELEDFPLSSASAQQGVTFIDPGVRPPAEPRKHHPHNSRLQLHLGWLSQ